MKEIIDKKLNPATNFVILGVSSSVARSVVAPWSVMKIYGEVGAPGGKMGPLQAAFWIRRSDGMKGFYRGSATAALRLFPYTGVQFLVYQSLADKWVRKPGGNPTIDSLINTYFAGAFAGVAATAVTHPLDVVKTRLTLNPCDPVKAYYRSAQDAVFKILQSEGAVTGLYRGFLISAVGSAVYSGVLFSGFEFVNNLPWMRRNKPFLPFEWFVDPLIAVGAAYTASYPLDVLRKKFMAYSPLLPKNGSVDISFRNYGQLIVENFARNGLPGFFTGLLSNSAKVLPQFAVFWMLVATLRRLAHVGDSTTLAPPKRSAAIA